MTVNLAVMSCCQDTSIVSVRQYVAYAPLSDFENVLTVEISVTSSCRISEVTGIEIYGSIARISWLHLI